VSLFVEPANRAPEKGLKSGALGLISSTVIVLLQPRPPTVWPPPSFCRGGHWPPGTHRHGSGLRPNVFVSLAFQQMNKADPDCGASFTWATRAFSPRVGWMGGWGVLAADVIVMASLAQIAGQYVFDLFNANGIGHDASSVWVLLVGVAWIIAMTGFVTSGSRSRPTFKRLCWS